MRSILLEALHDLREVDQTITCANFVSGIDKTSCWDLAWRFLTMAMPLSLVMILRLHPCVNYFVHAMPCDI